LILMGLPPLPEPEEAVGLDHRRFLAIQTDEHKAKIAEIDGRPAQKMTERDTITHHCKDRGGNCTAPAAESVYVGTFMNGRWVRSSLI
jgi:hypothetical protein